MQGTAVKEYILRGKTVCLLRTHWNHMSSVWKPQWKLNNFKAWAEASLQVQWNQLTRSLGWQVLLRLLRSKNVSIRKLLVKSTTTSSWNYTKGQGISPEDWLERLQRWICSQGDLKTSIFPRSSHKKLKNTFSLNFNFRPLVFDFASHYETRQNIQGSSFQGIEQLAVHDCHPWEKGKGWGEPSSPQLLPQSAFLLRGGENQWTCRLLG